MKNTRLLAIHNDKLFTDLNPPVKTKKRSLVYYIAAQHAILDSKILLYSSVSNILYLCKIVEELQVSPIKETHTKINRSVVYGNFTDKQFYTFKVLTQYKLKRKIKFPEEDKVYFLEKPIHNKLLAELIMSTDNPGIHNYLASNENSDTGVVPLKVKDAWGFLFYEKLVDGDYVFKFEPVNNVIDNYKLTQTEDGYKDFTYFIISHSLPKAIKIGRAENPTHRLKQIQAHNARDVEFEVILADGRLETYYHSKFDYLRINSNREWFEIDEDILEVIRNEKLKLEYIIGIFNKSEFKKSLF